MHIIYFVWIPIFGLSAVSLSAANLNCEEAINDSATIERFDDKATLWPVASSIAGTSWYMKNYNAVISFGKEESWGSLVMQQKKSGGTIKGSYTIKGDRHIVGEIGINRGETFDFILKNVRVTPERIIGSKSDGTVVSAIRCMKTDQGSDV